MKELDKDESYTVMPNYHLRDKTLSLKAKGLLTILFSLPNDWDYSVAGLITLSSDGKAGTRTAIKELEERGYLIRHPIKINGKFIDWRYIIPKRRYSPDVPDTPFLENQKVKISSQNHDVKEPFSDFQKMEDKNPQKPFSDFPLVEKPPMGNRTQININKINTKKTNTKVVVVNAHAHARDDNGKNVGNSVDNSFELMGGTLGKGVVLLTPEQTDALLDKLGLEGFNYYVEKLATFIIEKRAKVINHYQTILKWAEEDSEI